MSSIDQQFIEFIVKSLVGNPDAVQVERRIDEKGVLLELTVDPDDLGRVIGKRGATAQSLRTLLRALGTKNDARYNLKIVDNGEPRPEGDRPERPERTRQDDEVEQDDQPEDKTTDDTPTDDSAADDVISDDAAVTDEPETSSDSISRHRKELEDLDDLDI